MRSVLERIALAALISLTLAVLLLLAPVPSSAQGGEPQYFAIRAREYCRCLVLLWRKPLSLSRAE